MLDRDVKPGLACIAVDICVYEIYNEETLTTAHNHGDAALDH